VKQVDGMAFFTESKHDEFRNRVLRITSANPRQWGTMSVSQMLHHLNLACGGALGFYKLPDESYLVSRTVFRWILVDCGLPMLATNSHVEHGFGWSRKADADAGHPVDEIR
jgi:hypothetical protein